jgi:hypothetical protein
MQYYKVIKDEKVIDVLDHIHYLKYNLKHKRMFNSIKADAEAILSSDGTYEWHVRGLNKVPVRGYDTVELIEIDVYEYNKLKRFNLSTPEELIDNFVMELVEGGIL